MPNGAARPATPRRPRAGLALLGVVFIIVGYLCSAMSSDLGHSEQ